VSLTPIYDDLLREFQGIIEASANVEADDAGATAPAAAGTTPAAPAAGG